MILIKLHSSALIMVMLTFVKVKSDSKHLFRPAQNAQLNEISQLARMSSPFMVPSSRLPRKAAKGQQPTSYHSQAAEFYRPNHQPQQLGSEKYYDPSYSPSTYKESYDPTNYEPSFSPSSFPAAFKQPAKIIDHDNSETRLERQSGGGGGAHDTYVDFGAHTGHHGSFGWYADFPAHKDA